MEFITKHKLKSTTLMHNSRQRITPKSNHNGNFPVTLKSIHAIHLLGRQNLRRARSTIHIGSPDSTLIYEKSRKLEMTEKRKFFKSNNENDETREKERRKGKEASVRK